MSTFRIIERLKATLKQRTGTLGILNIFKEFDTDKSGKLSWEEFCA
jgi:Ca2+-binding EF-hand superfamily protein